MDFKYAQSWLLGIVCFVYGIYRVIGGSDKTFNWVDIVAILGFCYSIYVTQIASSKEEQFLDKLLKNKKIDPSYIFLNNMYLFA